MRNVLITALLIIQLWSTVVLAQNYYEVTSINGNLELYSLNNKGQAAGTDKSNFYKACIWDDGNIFDIPGTDYGEGLDINSSGDVCGWMSPKVTQFAFVYRNGKLDTITPADKGYASAIGINDYGWVTGGKDVVLNLRHVFLYKDGNITDLGTLGKTGQGLAINNLGWIVGFYRNSNDNELPFIYKGAQLDSLPLIPGATKGTAVDINDSGVVCGSNAQYFAVAVQWDSSGNVTPLPKMQGQIISQAASINNRGEIVGLVVLSGATESRAVLWKDETVRFLDALINPKLGLVFNEAIAINDSGQILCSAHIAGKTNYYILTPPHSRFVVNETGDESDADLSDGVCDVDLSQNGDQCTLRAAIEQAVYNGGAAHISFNIPGNGIPVIIPHTPLPEVSLTMAIDATTQPGGGLVELKGTQAGAKANGFTITASNSSLRGFVINEFGGYGIQLEGTQNDTIASCLIGTDPSGTQAAPNVLGGIYIHNAMNNLIGGNNVADRNVISGNGLSGHPRGHGILIEGKQSTGNRIEGNIIGANIDGTESLPNKAGVTITSASGNQVGGHVQKPGAPPGNLISGNSSWGVAIGADADKPPASSNRIMGNLIGTNLSGTDSLPGQKVGIWLISDADSNIIGGISANDKNVISGNTSMGFYISSRYAASSENQIMNNFIGVSVDGHRSIGNYNFGIFINDSPNNIIGGKISEARNVVTGNQGIQIFMAGENATGNKVAGNFIGVYSDGSTMPDELPLGPGVFVSSASKNIIGSERADEGNVISGNKFGIILERSQNNIIAGNKIGTDISGTIALGNQDKPGIALFRASDNVIGGISSIKRNLISGNVAGISLLTDQSDLNTGINNFSFRNNKPGMLFETEDYLKRLFKAHQQIKNYVTRPIPSIAESKIETINFRMRKIFPSLSNGNIKTENNKIIGNYIGTTDNGLDSLGNKEVGIFVGPGSNNNDIGGLLPGERNVISSNGRGITLYRADNCKVINNLIGTGKDRTTPLPNLHGGIQVLEAKRNYIGMGKAGAGNLISYNRGSNIELNGTRGNFVLENKIMYSNKGIAVFNAYRDQIISNRIWFNQTGLSSDGSNIILKGNSIKENSGTSTGIHFSNSSGEIAGNQIENNNGGGIRLDNGSTPLIHFNNIQGNQGYGVNNTMPAIPIDATNNWWGDASGPGGSGQGSGDPVSNGVNFGAWLTEPNLLFVATWEDTLYSRIGAADSTTITFLNWDNQPDAINITVEETSGWLRSPIQYTVQIDSGSGVGIVLTFEVPNNISPGDVDIVRITAVSQSNPTKTAKDSILIYPYMSILNDIAIFPDSATVSPNRTYQFSAIGRDQFGETMEFEPTWRAIYGNIDTSGLYTAPNFTTIDTVRVMDASSEIIAQAIVLVTGPTAIKDEESILPTRYELFQNYPNPFNPITTIRFEIPIRSRVVLEVYNILGERIATLVDEKMDVGYHKVFFDGSNFASGIYFYRIMANQFVDVKKMILLR